jgi:hypothetical protein
MAKVDRKSIQGLENTGNMVVERDFLQLSSN